MARKNQQVDTEKTRSWENCAPCLWCQSKRHGEVLPPNTFTSPVQQALSISGLDGEELPTFKEACIRHNLLVDDTELENAMEEAAH